MFTSTVHDEVLEGVNSIYKHLFIFFYSVNITVYCLLSSLPFNFRKAQVLQVLRNHLCSSCSMSLWTKFTFVTSVFEFKIVQGRLWLEFFTHLKIIFWLWKVILFVLASLSKINFPCVMLFQESCSVRVWEREKENQDVSVFLSTWSYLYKALFKWLKVFFICSKCLWENIFKY